MKRLILPMREWPSDHVRAWERMFLQGDIFDEQGPCTHWSAGSRQKRVQSYGHWLGFLARIGVPICGTAPGDLFTQTNIDEFVRNTRTRISLRSTYMQLGDIYVLATNLAPERDWSWLKGGVDRLRREVGSGDLKPRPTVSAAEIDLWAKRLTMEAETAEGNEAQRAVKFRTGLSMALLIARPIRERAFVNLLVGRHILATHDGYDLRIFPEDAKDGKSRTYPIPAALISHMRRYLEEHRKTLLAGRTSDRLWISRDGNDLTKDGFVGHMANVTQREFGKAMRPHSFRHIAATSIAVAEPGQSWIIAEILGHTNLRTSYKYYNRAGQIAATTRYQTVIGNLRSKG